MAMAYNEPSVDVIDSMLSVFSLTPIAYDDEINDKGLDYLSKIKELIAIENLFESLAPQLPKKENEDV